jgi:hypothetical protein
MVAIARRSPVVLFGAFLLAPLLHSLPAAGGEDNCVHLTGYGGPAQVAPAKRTVRQPGAGGGQAGNPLAIGICAVDNARDNTALPTKTNADFVPITGDDSLGFYCVYGVKASTTGGVGGNVCIYVFELTGGEVLVFGSGYGNTSSNLFDAAYDMERVDQIIRFCMGKAPATTPLRLLAPHGHGDHINPACNRELERLGYRIVEIAFHPGDQALVNGMAWSAADRALFRILPAGTTCLEELARYSSPLGKLWVLHRPGHTDGSIDLVIDIKDDVTNRFLVRGSQANTPCASLPGQRETSGAHSNVELLSIPPALADVTPLSGPAQGGTVLTLTGAEFTAAGAGAQRVMVNGILATDVVVASDTSLTCKTPAGPAGELVEVKLVNNNGQAIYAGTYFYNPLPTVTSISPISGDWRGGTIAQVRGTGFLLTSGVNEVYFGANRGTGVSVKSSTLLTVRVPAGAPGALVPVILRNPNGETRLDNAFRYSTDLVITSVQPPSATALGGTTVLLSGTTFTGDGSPPTVTFGGDPALQVTLLSDTSISAVVPPGVPGTLVDVVLTNSLGTATYGGFRYHLLPRITALTPASGRALGGSLVTLTGTGFLVDGASTNQVRFGGVPATGVTVLSDTSLRCSTPAAPEGSVVNVTVTNQNGTATLPLAYTYTANLDVLSVLPVSGTASGGTAVTITGDGFVDGTAGTNTVRFGGVPATQVVAVDDGTITCRTPAGTPLAVVDVQVTNGSGAVTLPAVFRYHARPTVTAVSPNHGHADATTPVSLTGTGFLVDSPGPNVILVGGVAATNVQVLSNTSLLCTFPPGTPGTTVNVVLTNQNGSATLTGGFRYHGAPTLLALSPVSGGSTQQQRVTLTGTGFLDDQAGTPTITFGGLPASAVSVTSDQLVRCNAPVGTPGQTVDVVLSNARGSAALPRAYRYHAKPTLTAVAPVKGAAQGGTTVTLTGTGFLVDGAGVNVVSFGGSFASGVVVLGDTAVRCVTPPGPQDAMVDVVISNTNGSAMLAGGFSYSVQPPVVTAVVPGSGPALAPGSVQIIGSGFVDDGAGANTVRFGGAASGIVGVIDDTRLSCQVPPGTPGTSVDVVVTNENGTGQLARAFRYHSVPVLTALSPTAGSPVGGTAVQLTGAGFLVDSPGPNLVTFGGIPAQNVVAASDGTLTCVAPAGTSGTQVVVRVGNANGQTATLPFSYHARPRLTGVTPESGPLVGGTRVTLTGLGFLKNSAGSNTVIIGRRPALNVVVVSDTQITCYTPSGDAGYVDVTVTNSNGSGQLAGGFHYGKLPPAITSVEPNHGPQRGQTLVTVKGRGFSGGTARVLFGGSLSSNVIAVDDETLLCLSAAGKPGTTVDVSVEVGTSRVTLARAFRYHALPTLTSISPTQGEALKETRVTLTGTGFVVDGAGSPEVFFSGMRARDVSVLDDRRIVCKTIGGGPGAVLDVVVRNANGAATLPDAFRILGGPPSIHSISPASGPFLGGTRVSFEGAGFASGTARVSFGDQPALDLVVSDDTHLACTTPPGTLGSRVTVSLSTKYGTAALVGGFTYEALRPELTAVVPVDGPATGGTRATLTGRYFTATGAGTTRVTFDYVPATAVTVVGDGTITCTVPAGRAGMNVDVAVINDNGQAGLLRSFRYHAAPTLTGVTPAIGPAAGGTAVAITGTGFTADGAGASTVLFGTQSARNVVVVSDTRIDCTTPPGTSGTTVNVTVTNLNGSAALPAAFGYRVAPRIDAVSPPRGTNAGGTTLTITGTGFQAFSAGVNRVTIKGAPALAVTTVSDTTITCTTPAVASGGPADVVVANDNGSHTAAGAFVYFVPPTLTAIAPASGPALGGTAVTLTGRGFLDAEAGANLVLFGGVPAGDVVETSDTAITCNTPPGTGGTQVDVTVINANGVAALAGGFRYNGGPVVEQVTPDHGPRGGASVTLRGRGLQANGAGTNTVTFGAVAATQVVVLDDLTLTCRAPAGTPGSRVDVTLSNANGTSTLPAAFRYHAEPTISAVLPGRGPAAGDTGVTITGTGFQVDDPGNVQVIMGGFGADSVVVQSDTSLTCRTPSGFPDARVNVTVANANGQATLVDGFRYNPAPTLGSILPVQGPAQGGTTVTLTGSGFALGQPGPNSVTFGGTPATNVVAVDDRTLTCVTPPGTVGARVDVVLRNLSGQSTLASAYRYSAQPALAALAPVHGSPLGGAEVTLTGSGFADPAAGVTTVRFGATEATGVLVLDDQHVRCTAPPGPAGSVVDVALTNGNGSAALAAAYRYHAAPTLGAVLPAVGSSVEDTAVTLAGTGFLADDAGATTVLFGAAPALGVSVIDDATIVCQVPPQAAGSVVDVGVANANGSAVLAQGFMFETPLRLTAITPASGPAAGGGTVTLTGGGFLASGAGTNAVAFGGSPAGSVTVLDDSSLSCVVPAGIAGSLVDVVLTNGNGSAQLAGGYRYHLPPTIATISPIDGTSLGGTLVTVRGTGFLNDAAGTIVVRFGDRLATAVGVFDDGRLTCRAPSGTAGTSVTLTLTSANGSTQLVDGYRYHARPTLTAVTPASGTSLGGSRVTLTGTGFLVDGAVLNVVSFGGVTATSVVVRNDRTIECNVPAGTPGLQVQVGVANVNGTGQLPNGYRYHARPALASVEPPDGPLEGGTLVTLTGGGFQNDSAGTNTVTFGGVAASAVTVLGDAQLTCLTPPGLALGPVDVVASNANGAATLLGAFSYTGTAPMVAGALPGKGTTQGSTAVTLTGSGFLAGATVSFGDEPALDVRVVDENTIECLTPPSPTGRWVDVRVRSSGLDASLPLGFQYVAPPTLASVAPGAGLPEGGTMVVLNGSGFVNDGAGENRVSFAGVPALNVTVLDDAHIACEVPSGQLLTDAEVVVVNDNGAARLEHGFRWQLLLSTDLDSDGRGDLILGSPGDDTLGRDAGAVHVFFGSTLPVGDKSSSEADLTALPERVATAFGMPVASGDLDGDGHAELLVGAPLDDRAARDAGAVYVFAGPLVASPTALALSQATTILTSSRLNDRLGNTLALHDLDRNGILDVLAGAPGGSGAVHVFLGGTGGLATDPALVIPGSAPLEGFSSSLAAGDLDGDGWADIMVGAPTGLGLTTGPTARPGVVRVYRGGATLFTDGPEVPWLVFAGLQDGEGFGTALAAADLAADGIEDLIVGSPWNSRSGLQSGAIFVFSGRADVAGGNSSAAETVLSAEGASDRFGISIATGDVNGDGQADLLTGAPLYGPSGRAYLFLGGPTFGDRAASAADVLLEAEVASQGEFGRTVALVDVDGNGLADMVVTAPRLDAGGTDLGRVYVFGASTSPTRAGEDDDATLTGSAAGDLLGRSLTGDH